MDNENKIAVYDLEAIEMCNLCCFRVSELLSSFDMNQITAECNRTPETPWWSSTIAHLSYRPLVIWPPQPRKNISSPKNIFQLPIIFSNSEKYLVVPVVSPFGNVSEAAAEWPHVLDRPEPGAGGGPLLAGLLGPPPRHVDAGPRPLPRHRVLALAVLRHLEDHLEIEQHSIYDFSMDLC